MQAHEIFRRLTADEVAQYVEAACEDDEIPDKIAGGVLTYQKIPLTRFMKLSDEQRVAYVRRTLRDRQAAELSLYVLSAALTKGKAALISRFLDELGLEHDGPSIAIDGELPEPSAKKLKAAVDKILKEFPPRDVAVYLNAFASQPGVSWKGLDERLASDAALALGDVASA